MAKPPTEPIPFSMDADWLFPRLARRKITFCGSFTIANNLGEVSTKAQPHKDLNNQAIRVCPHHFSSTVYLEGTHNFLGTSRLLFLLFEI